MLIVKNLNGVPMFNQAREVVTMPRIIFIFHSAPRKAG
jgi:hypothetical protein